MSSLYYRSEPVEKYKYVVTIAVFSHGLTTTLNLTPAIAELMENVRMYSITSKFGSSIVGWASSSHDDEWVSGGVYNHLKNIYQKNISGAFKMKTIMDDYADYSRPEYEYTRPSNIKEFQGKIGNVYDPVTFDKVYTDEETSLVASCYSAISNCLYGCKGIKLVSIHRRSDTSEENELIYPLKHHLNKEINLLKTSDISDLSTYMHKDGHVYQDLGLSILSSNGEEMIPESGDGFQEKYSQFVKNGNKYDPYVKGNSVEFIRLSQLMYMMTNLFDIDTELNVFDYACSNLYSKITEEEIKKHDEKHDELVPRQSPPTFLPIKSIQQDTPGLRTRSPRPITPISGMLRGGNTTRNSRRRNKNGNGPTCSKCVQSTIDNTTLPKAKLSSEMPTATKAYPVKPDMELWADLHPRAKVNEPIQTATRAGGGKKSRKMKKPRRKTRSKKSKTKKNKKSKK